MQYEAQTLEEPPAERTDDFGDRHSHLAAAQGSSTCFQSNGVRRRYQPPDQFIRKILVPTDFSACSSRALEFAVSLAREFQAKLTILHVIDINTQSAHGDRWPAADLMKRLWETGFQEMGKLAFSVNGNVDAQTAVEEGVPCEQIVEKSREVDLLVLGKSAPKPGWRLFAKHTAQRVIEHAACPVIVVQDRD
jgi:nucleotide-binding universal stress UspA family protein